jgi:hypothetical protein
MLDQSWRRGKRTSTYGAAAKLVMRILTCLFIYLTRTQGVEWLRLRRSTLIQRHVMGALETRSTANASMIAEYCHTMVWLSRMQEQKLLRHHWRLIVGDISDVVTSIFGCKGGQCNNYVLQRPHLFLSIRLTRPKIIDISLMLISRVVQPVWNFPFCLLKRPIES